MSLVIPDGPKLFFFYGTLQLPQILQRVLGLQETPTLREAKISGYRIRMWGRYPALVKVPSSTITVGKAWIMHVESHLARLAYYETRNYRLEAVEIAFEGSEDGMTSSGFTFVWNGAEEDLKDGEFDADRFLPVEA